MSVRERHVRMGGRPATFDGRSMNGEQPLGDLFRQLSDDATRLVRQEVALGKAELRETGSALVRDAVSIGIAVGLAVLGAMAATAFLIIALGGLLGSYWLSSLLVAVAYLATAAVLAKRAKADIQSRELKPTRTIETVREDAEWAKREAAAVRREWKS